MWLRQFRKRRRERTKLRPSNPKLVLIRQIVLGIFLFLLLLGIGTGIWYGTRIEALTISNIRVIGGETVSHQEVTAIANQVLDGSYYRLIPRRFAWLYPETTLHAAVLAEERIKNVSLERTSGTDLTIVFEEHVPYALWCEKIDSKQCLFLDRDGLAFGTAPTLEGEAFLRFSETNRVPVIDETIFSREFIETTLGFIENAYNELALPIIQVEKTGEEELVYHLSGGGQLKVSLRLSTAETLDNLRTILTSPAFAHIEPGNFQYIDLRYGNKVFVNEELAVASTTTPFASTTASSTD